MKDLKDALLHRLNKQGAVTPVDYSPIELIKRLDVFLTSCENPNGETLYCYLSVTPELQDSFEFVDDLVYDFMSKHRCGLESTWLVHEDYIAKATLSNFDTPQIAERIYKLSPFSTFNINLTSKKSDMPSSFSLSTNFIMAFSGNLNILAVTDGKVRLFQVDEDAHKHLLEVFKRTEKTFNIFPNLKFRTKKLEVVK